MPALNTASLNALPASFYTAGGLPVPSQFVSGVGSMSPGSQMGSAWNPSFPTDPTWNIGSGFARNQQPSFGMMGLPYGAPGQSPSPFQFPGVADPANPTWNIGSGFAQNQQPSFGMMGMPYGAPGQSPSPFQFPMPGVMGGGQGQQPPTAANAPGAPPTPQTPGDMYSTIGSPYSMGMLQRLPQQPDFWTPGFTGSAWQRMGVMPPGLAQGAFPHRPASILDIIRGSMGSYQGMPMGMFGANMRFQQSPQGVPGGGLPIPQGMFGGFQGYSILPQGPHKPFTFSGQQRPIQPLSTPGAPGAPTAGMGSPPMGSPPMRQGGGREEL